VPFTAVTTDKVRVNVTATKDGSTYLSEVEAWTSTGAGSASAGYARTTATSAGIPPTATTLLASQITASSALLNGAISTKGAATSVGFNYGASARYGSQVVAAESPLPASVAGSTVSAFATGLTCNTTYHYRVNAVADASNQAYGSDVAFTTAACPVSLSSSLEAVQRQMTQHGVVQYPAIMDLGQASKQALLTGLVAMLSKKYGDDLKFIEQTTMGTMVVQGSKIGKLAWLPHSFHKGDTRSDGVYDTEAGQYEAVVDGQLVVLSPAVVHLDQLLSLFAGVRVSIDDAGVISATRNGVTYVVRPDAMVQFDTATGQARLQATHDAAYEFVDGEGNKQNLRPAFSETAVLKSILQEIDLNATLTIRPNSVAAVLVNGQRMTLVPSLTLKNTLERDGGRRWWQEGEN